MKEKKHILFVLNLLTLQCVYFPSILAQRGGKKGISWNLGIVRRKWICIFFVLFELPAIIFLCEIQIWNLAILNIIPENSIPRYLHLWWACYYWDEEILFSNMLKIEIFIAELSLSLSYIYIGDPWVWFGVYAMLGAFYGTELFADGYWFEQNKKK